MHRRPRGVPGPDLGEGEGAEGAGDGGVVLKVGGDGHGGGKIARDGAVAVGDLGAAR